jgi:formylglycine-generating enzyme required for sulfatase activity
MGIGLEEKIMNLKYICYCGKTFLIILVLLSLGGCDLNNTAVSEPEPYVFTGTYNLVRVPVPNGGIDFPIGIDDDDTARVENAYYIGETEITHALWDTVSRWATEEKEVGKYYGLVHTHHSGWDAEYNSDYEGIYKDVPITSDFGIGSNTTYGYVAYIGMFYVVPTWCNAFTEWYNEQYGTNFVPVYQDSHGNPIRYINNSDNFFETANPNATGFRLPTVEEWELAARWSGSNTINTVTKTINGIDFSAQAIKFTTGRSASGAGKLVEYFDENDLVAVWKNNSKGTPKQVKSKKPNMLWLYDMSGNVRELTSTFRHTWTWGIDDLILVQSRGGSADSDSEELAVGNPFEGVDGRGFRVVRNAE